MLTLEQLAHFEAFGFVVLRGLFRPGEIRILTSEVVDGLTDAYGGVGTGTDPERTGGIRGDYLPLSADRTPLSQSLMADDPRLFQGSAELLGHPTVPTAPIATCFTSNSGWHTDDGTGVGGVKFLAHLQPRSAATGALRVIPGSHLPEFAGRVAAYQGRDPASQGFPGWSLPHVALGTEPGDVIAFDVHVLHSSDGGSDRLAWSIEYLAWPGLGDRSRMAMVRDYIMDCADYPSPGYDDHRWPTWTEWAGGPPWSRSGSRQVAIDRLMLLGVLSGREDVSAGLPDRS